MCCCNRTAGHQGPDIVISTTLITLDSSLPKRATPSKEANGKECQCLHNRWTRSDFRRASLVAGLLRGRIAIAIGTAHEFLRRRLRAGSKVGRLRIRPCRLAC
uniref:(northern house mosquito) hypothetical protein n=1 Tax=Culex pipiens TaxID=7175 RepID=A0A8D8DWB7_CULPI